MAATKKDRGVPAALAKRAARLKAEKARRMRAEGRELIAFVRRKKAEAADAFYEMGVALGKLRDRDMLRALGCRPFEALCRDHVGLSVELAAGVADVAARLSREQAIAMGQGKALAVIRLADATAAPDRVIDVYENGVTLPDGRHFSPKRESPHQIDLAAKAVRHARAAGGPRRGLTTTREERVFAEKLQRALRAAGAPEARVVAVASKPGHESFLRIDRVRPSALRALAKTLGKLSRA